jgi:hypothetical protein
MVHIAFRNGKGAFCTDVTLDQLPRLRSSCASKDSMLWVELFVCYSCSADGDHPGWNDRIHPPARCLAW